MDSLGLVFFWRRIKLNRKDGYVFVKGERYGLWRKDALFECRAASFEELSDIKHNEIPRDLRFRLHFAWQLGVNKAESSLSVVISHHLVQASLEIRDWRSPVSLEEFQGRMEWSAKDGLRPTFEKKSGGAVYVVLTTQALPEDTVYGTADTVFSLLRQQTLWLKQEEEKAYRNLEQKLLGIKVNLATFQQRLGSVPGMFSMVLRDLGSDDVVLLFASANPEWARSWIRQQLKGDLVVKSYDILRHLGLVFYDSSYRVWKVTRLGLETLKAPYS